MEVLWVWGAAFKVRDLPFDGLKDLGGLRVGLGQSLHTSQLFLQFAFIHGLKVGSLQ